MANGAAASRAKHEPLTMEYFDRLPAMAREVAARARFDWALASWLSMFERGRVTEAQLAERIEFSDQLEAAKTRNRAWGPGYPIENAPPHHPLEVSSHSAIKNFPMAAYRGFPPTDRKSVV